MPAECGMGPNAEAAKRLSLCLAEWDACRKSKREALGRLQCQLPRCPPWINATGVGALRGEAAG